MGGCSKPFFLLMGKGLCFAHLKSKTKIKHLLENQSSVEDLCGEAKDTSSLWIHKVKFFFHSNHQNTFDNSLHKHFLRIKTIH